MAKKGDAVSKWLDKINRAKKVKENWRERFRVDLAYEYYEGNQRPPDVPLSEWITVNKLYADMQSELPSLYAQDPEFYVKLKRSYSVNPMDVALYDERSAIRQAMLNYLKDELGLKSKARLSIFDAFFQYGVCKTTHAMSMVDNPDAGQDILGSDGNVLLDDNGKPLVEPKQIPETNKANQFSVERLHPDDFLVDEDATPLAFGWCAHRLKARVETIKADKKFNASARNKIQATEVSDLERNRERRKKGEKIFDSGKDPKPDIVVYYEVWDTVAKQFFVVSEGCPDEFLMDPAPYPPGIEDHPFEFLRYTLRDDSWYPFPPMAPKLDPQREISETRSKILTHRKRFNRKYECWVAAFDDPEIELAKLATGEDGTVLRKAIQQQAVMPIPDGPLDMAVHTELAYLDRDFAEYGAGANQRGSGAGIDSATEAGIQEKRFMVKEGDRQMVVSEFLGDIGKKLDMLVQANLTQELAIRVKGAGGEYWEMVRPTDYDSIAGEYTTGVLVGSHTPQLPEIERAQALNFLSLIAQAPQLAGSPALMRYIGKMFSIHENDMNLMINELQQVNQQMQEAQMAQKGIGSMPGIPEGSRAQSAMPGMAMGINNVRGGQQ